MEASCAISAVLLLAVLVGGGCAQDSTGPEHRASKGDSEKPLTLDFLAVPKSTGASSRAVADPPPPKQTDDQQRRIRETAAEWVDSGRLQALMAAQKPEIRTTGESVGFADLRAVAGKLLDAVGLSLDTAPISCRETAVAQAMLAIEGVRRTNQRHRERSDQLRRSSEYEQLRDSLAAGFDGLSEPNVFLDDAHLAQLAQEEINKAYSRESPGVCEKLSEDLARFLTVRANTAWEEFSLYVRYIFFGNEQFGDRETYLIHKGFEARQKAIEARILKMVSENPKYKEAILDPGNVQGPEGIHPDRNPKKLIRQHAANLAEAIRDVPARGP